MGEALEQLLDLKRTYDDEFNRTPGWDQQARSQAVKIVVKNHFGEHDMGITATDAFLIALIYLMDDGKRMGEVRKEVMRERAE